MDVIPLRCYGSQILPQLAGYPCSRGYFRILTILTVSIEEFIFYMKLFIDYVRLPQQLYDRIKDLSEDFTRSLSLFNKFEEIWSKRIGMKDAILQR